ncbi:MAG TPA: hypothetical protein VFW07_01530 [Parafilimonas sp.]|nr:hypothetical protein [Parafilimonas sp.]
MTSISARMRFLIKFVKIPPEMWDFIVSHGPAMKSHAIKEYMLAALARDISYEIDDKEIAYQLKSAGAAMVKFAAAHLINGWEEGDDLCPPWPSLPYPHYSYDPEPTSWFSTDVAELNPQPLPPHTIISALKVLAQLTSLPNVQEQLKDIAHRLEYEKVQ